MALQSRVLDDVQALGKGRVLIAGNFTSAGGTSNPDATEGVGWSVTHTGTTGEYQITLPGVGTVDVLSATFTVEGSTPTLVSIEARDDSSHTLTLKAWQESGGTLGAADLADGDIVHFQVVIKNSTVVNG